MVVLYDLFYDNMNNKHEQLLHYSYTGRKRIESFLGNQSLTNHRILIADWKEVSRPCSWGGMWWVGQTIAVIVTWQVRSSKAKGPRRFKSSSILFKGLRNHRGHVERNSGMSQTILWGRLSVEMFRNLSSVSAYVQCPPRCLSVCITASITMLLLCDFSLSASLSVCLSLIRSIIIKLLPICLSVWLSVSLWCIH